MQPGEGPSPAMVAGTPAAPARAPDLPAVPFALVGREPPAGEARWSADGWVLLRPEGGAGASGAAPATYGASQAGAVLRYRLAPGSGHRPALHLRASAALNGTREQDLALGFSARPLPAVPLVLGAELRAARQPAGTQLRPAVLAVTELPPFALPGGLRGEAYGQAGWVGGRFATAFADGQLRADRGVTPPGRAELRLGAGVWGGAQKDAARLDAGPSAILAFDLGRGVPARLALDWRFRVAGDAAPASGPALALSAGF